MWITILAALGIITFIIAHVLTTKNRLPPGPNGLIFFGNVFQLEKGKSHKTITEWSRKYGDVFKIKMFGADFVILNSYESIYEALVTKANEFAGRPPSFRSRTLMGGHDDVSLSTFSRKWLYMKKSMMVTLKMYGDNMLNLERLALELIEDMLEEISGESKEKEAFEIVPIIHRCTTAIITSVVYGKKEKREKVEILADLTETTQKLLEPAGIYVMLDILPWLRFFPLQAVRELYKTSDDTEKWYFSELLERKEKFIAGDPQCFVDGLFDQQRIADVKQSEFRLSDDDIVGMTKNMIVAGTITTTTTMNALIPVLIRKPEVQQNIAREVSKVLKKRPPCLADRPNFPYTEAVILESLRYSSILPLNLTHYTMVDTSVNGYKISKDTQVLTNLWNLHHNEDYWEEPWEFKPERFIDNNGVLVTPDHINRKRLLPFGASRRVCPGENLARSRLFLMLVSIIQNFELLPESPDKIPDPDPRKYDSTLSILIPPYKVIAIPRK